MDAAISVESASHKAGQVEGKQHRLRTGSVDRRNADPVHVLTSILEDQVRIAFDLPFKGRAAGVGVHLVNVRVVSGIAQIEVAIGVKTDVLREIEVVRIAKAPDKG